MRRSGVVALDDSVLPDLWTLKRRFPHWLPWIDADYGSAAYLPLRKSVVWPASS